MMGQARCRLISNVENGRLMTQSFELFAQGFKREPYWWEAAPRPTVDETRLPATVGSGYTGLQAAIQTARGGRDTVVVDSEAVGFGCSSRNGGQVSTSIKPSFQELERLHGSQVAHGIREEGIKALDYLDSFINTEGLQCNWRRVGRFHGAYHRRHYDALARDIGKAPKGLEIEAHMVPRSEQYGEIGTDLYHGGVVFPQHASLHPGKYHQGLLDLARAAGVRVVSYCPVNAVTACRNGFLASTDKGIVQARDVIIATNGYTKSLTPWLQRRVIPIGSYMIATQELDPALVSKLCPKARVMSDTRKLVFYYRICPDNRRILFGGRVALKETNPDVSAPRLHKAMCKIFPELQHTQITHSWLGFVAYTFDTLPHFGVTDGLHYAMGYCGSGVSLASYFGRRLGEKVLGREAGKSPLEGVDFRTRPFYFGDPWFLAPSVLAYQLRDRIGI